MATNLLTSIDFRLGILNKKLWAMAHEAFSLTSINELQLPFQWSRQPFYFIFLKKVTEYGWFMLCINHYLDSIAQASYLFIVRLTIIYTFCILHIWFRDCWQITSVTLNRFCPLSNPPPPRIPCILSKQN